MIRYGWMLLLTVAVSASQASAAGLMLTGVMDGDLPGGEPKMVEVFARENIADLSTYAVTRAGNGSSTWDTITANYILPAISLNAGDFYYLVGNAFTDQTDTFDSIWPSKSGIRSRNSGVNSNGDDVTGLFRDDTGAFAGGETLVDVIGELGVDGSGTAWEHTDSYLYSMDGRSPSAVFNVADWHAPGPGALDGLDAAGHAAAFPDMTYVVPEPASLALLGLGGLAFLRRRSA